MSTRKSGPVGVGSVTTPRVVIGHSVMGDLDTLLRVGYPVRPEWVEGRDVWDSLLLARMADETRLSYGLEDLVCDEFPVRPWKEPSQSLFEASGDMGTVPPEVLQERCRRDAWGSALLVGKYAPTLPPGLVEFTHRTAATLHRMCLAGGTVWRPAVVRFIQDVEAAYGAKREVVRAAALGVGMADLSPSNDFHLRELLFKRLGLSSAGSTPTGLPRVDADALAALDHPVVRMIEDYAEWEKLNSTYAKSFAQRLRDLSPDVGWLEWHINPLGARTGRRSSQDPNSQNLPPTLRACFCSRFPGGRIFSGDFARLEVVIIAWLSGEERLLQWFTGGRGYIDVAKALLGQEVEDGTDAYKTVKQLVLATHYRARGKRAAEVLRGMGIIVSDREAQALQDRYLRAFPGLRRYMDARREEMVTTGAIRSPVGRVRHLPCPDGEATPGFWGMWNQAVNFPVQSLASDITAAACLDVEVALCAAAGVSLMDHHRALVNWHATRMGLTAAPRCVLPSALVGKLEHDGPVYSLLTNEVHDELVVDLHPAAWERDAGMIREVMEAGRSLSELCPEFPARSLRVSVSAEERWR